MPPVTYNQLVSRAAKSRPLYQFKPGVRVTSRVVTPDGQSTYTYTLREPAGANFAPNFKPRYSPGQMLKLGVFSGRYINDCTGEFPREWFTNALAAGKLCPEGADPGVNLFKVKSRKPIKYWRGKGWIPLVPGDPDTRGWFMWYCRYWLGRRISGLDEMQIKRWAAFRRHAGQIIANNSPERKADKYLHRPAQRQALLQWSYDPWV